MKARAFANQNRQTCIVYGEDDGLVFAVTMQTPELGLLEMGHDQFHSQWAQIEGCNAEKAAHQYLMGLIPYNDEVKSILEKIMSDGTEGTAVETTEKVVKAKAKSKSGDVKVTKVKAPAKEKAATSKTAAFFADQEKKKAGKAKPAAEPAKGKAKAKAEPAEPKAKRGRAPKEDISAKIIHLLPAAAEKRFQEGSVRSQCFALIKDGMSVKAFLAAVVRKQICEEPTALACLVKLIDTTQKTPTVVLKDK